MVCLVFDHGLPGRFISLWDYFCYIFYCLIIRNFCSLIKYKCSLGKGLTERIINYRWSYFWFLLYSIFLFCCSVLSHWGLNIVYNDRNLFVFKFFQFEPLQGGIAYSTCHFCRGHLKIEIRVYSSWFRCADVTDLVYIFSCLICRQLLRWWPNLKEGNSLSNWMDFECINLGSIVRNRQDYCHHYHRQKCLCNQKPFWGFWKLL